MRTTPTRRAIGLRRLAWVVSAAIAALLAGCGSGPGPATGSKAPDLATYTMQSLTVPGKQTWEGTVEAIHRTLLAAQTNARVEALTVEVGDHVVEGQELARLTNIEQSAAVHNAQAAVAAADARYANTQKDLQRAAALEPIGGVTRASLDAAVAGNDSARAALQSAQAQLRTAQRQETYTVIRAPFAGVITRRLVHVGEAVQAGPPAPQPLLEMASLDALRVEVTVPQASGAAIRKSTEASVRIADGPSVTASKVSVLPAANPNTHTFSVRVEVPLGTPDAYPGMAATVTFRTDSTDRLLVPSEALWRNGELTGVYGVSGTQVSLRLVRLGHRFGDSREVLSGLEVGDRVVRDPLAAVAWLIRERSRKG